MPSGYRWFQQHPILATVTWVLENTLGSGNLEESGSSQEQNCVSEAPVNVLSPKSPFTSVRDLSSLSSSNTYTIVNNPMDMGEKMRTYREEEGKDKKDDDDEDEEEGKEEKLSKVDFLI